MVSVIMFMIIVKMKSTVEMSMPNITVKSYYYRRSTANKASVLKKK